MDRNFLVVILSSIVIIIGLYQIFGLGESNWANYLSTVMFALVLILTLKSMRDQK